MASDTSSLLTSSKDNVNILVPQIKKKIADVSRFLLKG